MNSLTESADDVRELEIEVIETDKGEIPTINGLKDLIDQIYKDFETLARPLEKISSELTEIKKKQEHMEATLRELSDKIESPSQRENLDLQLQQNISNELHEIKKILKEKEREQDVVVEQLLGLVKKMSGTLIEYYQDLEDVKKKHEQDIVEARLLLAESIALLERTVNELRSYVLEIMKAFMTEPRDKTVVQVQEKEDDLEVKEKIEGFVQRTKDVPTHADDGK